LKLNVSNISVKISQDIIIENINFSLESGEIICLLGPNGCGKTTVLKAICGMLELSSGSIDIEGLDVSNFNSKVIPVLQGLFLWPHLTAKENILLPLKNTKLTSLNIQKRLDFVIERLNLDVLLNKYPREMSGGEQQRVAIARAIALKPEYLLLDEITSALDVEQIKFVADTLLYLRKAQIGVLFITHHIGLAEKISDKFIFMSNGKIETEGLIEDFRKKSNNRLNGFLDYV
jgi:ABC-type sugar transport system ATPase subunit